MTVLALLALAKAHAAYVAGGAVLWHLYLKARGWVSAEEAKAKAAMAAVEAAAKAVAPKA